MSLKTLLVAAEKDVDTIVTDIEIGLEGAETIVENEILPFAIGLGNGLKLITAADSSDFIGGIFGKAGIVVEDETRLLVANILPKLQFAQTLKGDTLEEIVDAITPVLEAAESDLKTKLVEEFVAQVVKDFAENKGIKLTITQAWMLAQLYFSDKAQLAAAEQAAGAIAGNATVTEGKAGAEQASL